MSLSSYLRRLSPFRSDPPKLALIVIPRMKRAESNVNLNAQDEVRCESFLLRTLDAFGSRGARLWADPWQRYLNRQPEYVRHLALETRSGYPWLL